MSVFRNILDSLGSKPWEHAGETEGLHGEVIQNHPSKRIALRVFLAVVSSMFLLFFVAYIERMEVADWRPVALPSVLWANTIVLVLGSFAFHYARTAAGAENRKGVKNGLILAGVLTVGFLLGQYIAWQQLEAAGYFMRSNPASAFFYVLTGLHGLHVIGGLVVWALATIKLMGGEPVGKIRLSVQLCSTYWHYLLIVWLVMYFILLSTS